MKRLVIALFLFGVTPALAQFSDRDGRPVTPRECQLATAYSQSHGGTALLVLHNGRRVCETGKSGPDRAYELWSGTKSFVGLMAAAAVTDGFLTFDERVAGTLTEWEADSAKRQVTIRDLLSMTSGQSSQVGRPEGYADSANAPLAGLPGQQFRYGPTPIQTFGEVLTRKLRARGSRETALDYLRRRILAPAGITVTEWRDGPDGNPLLPQGAVMTARQWGAFGELVRNRATVAGKPLVRPQAFAELFHGTRVNPAYGLTWWLPNRSSSDDPMTASFDLARAPNLVPADLVVAAGAGDQRLYVIPSRGLTVVRFGKLDLLRLRHARGRWSDVAFLDKLGVTYAARKE